MAVILHPSSRAESLRRDFEAELANHRNNLFQTMLDLGSFADKCRSSTAWHNGARSISGAVGFATGVTGVVGLCIITGGAVVPAAVTLETIGVIGGAASSFTALLNSVAEWRMDTTAASHMGRRYEEVSPILQKLANQYAKMLQAFAEEHHGVGDHQSHAHVSGLIHLFVHTVHEGVHIGFKIADIGTDLGEIASKSGFLGMASTGARACGIAFGASTALLSLAESINSALSSHAASSDIADLIDSAADRIAVCLHRYRPFMNYAELDSVLEIPQLLKIQLGPPLTFRRPSYRIGDALVSGGDEEVEAYFQATFPDGRICRSATFAVRFNSSDNTAVVEGSQVILTRAKCIDVSNFTCKVQAFACRGWFHKATFGDSSMTKGREFNSLGQHEDVADSGFRGTISFLATHEGDRLNVN